jgi:hypothetical protein
MQMKYKCAAMVTAGLAIGAYAYAQGFKFVTTPTGQEVVVTETPGQSSLALGLLSAQLRDSHGTLKLVPVTGFSTTIPLYIGYVAWNPAGTLATGAAVLPTPTYDGARVCVFTTQAITAFTLTAASGTLNNAPTTLAANTGACYSWTLATTTWDRT